MCRLIALGSLYLFNTCTSRHIDILHIDINGMLFLWCMCKLSAVTIRQIPASSCVCNDEQHQYSKTPALNTKCHQSLDSSTSDWTFAPVTRSLHQSLDSYTLL